MLKNQKGVAHVLSVVLVVVALAAVGAIVYIAIGKRMQSGGSDSSHSMAGGASWMWDGQMWMSEGDVPACPDPLKVELPVPASSIESVLYPGQTRGNDYKSHGGFRFEETSNNVNVVAPMDAQLVEASRYIEQGETQYYLIFINPCGVAYKLDHLLTLAPEFQAVADTLPPAKPDDSRTTQLEHPMNVKAGQLIATAVGFANSKNVSLDFGLYDLRKPNGYNLSSAGQDPNGAQFNSYGLCWFENVSDSDASVVRALPAADGQSGKTSDYCKG